MIVVDASVVIEVLLRSPDAARFEARLFAPAELLLAPHLMDIEVAQVLRRYVVAGECEASRAEEALEDLADMPIERYPHGVLLHRIWQLRGNLSAYDAAYVALAEATDAILLTRDRHFAGAPGNRARVEIV